MANIRTYNPSVRVGNWLEDIQLEEDTIKDFLDRKEKGELLIQKFGGGLAGGSVNMTVSTTGQLNFGDNIQLVNPGADQRLVQLSRSKSRDAAIISVGMGENLPATGAHDKTPSLRNVLTVLSCDGTPDGQPVLYNQPFQLVSKSSSGELLFLMSDRATFGNAAKKSRHQLVNFTTQQTFLTQWKAEFFNPQLRMEHELTPISMNEKVIIKHVKTNQSLAVEEGCFIKSLHGAELEISTHTFFDDHKAERDVNHWVFKSKAPE